MVDNLIGLYLLEAHQPRKDRNAEEELPMEDFLDGQLLPRVSRKDGRSRAFRGFAYPLRADYWVETTGRFCR
jgi:hypothetical protein